jgi:hypothetical protein
MENEAMMGDTLRKTDSPEREMINRDKHGAVVELAVKGTPKKAIARMLGVGIKSVRRILTFIERVVSGCVDAEFAAYAALPEINTDEINRWFWIDGPAYREILNLLVRHKERGWVLSNNLNPSTKRLIDIRVKTVEAEEAVVHTNNIGT